MNNHYQWITPDQIRIPEVPEYPELPILPTVTMKPVQYTPPAKRKEEEQVEGSTNTQSEKTYFESPAWNLIYLNAKIKVPVFKTPFLIGSDEENDFILAGDPSVSRKHARLTIVEDGIILEDLNSSNHIFIGSDQLKDKILLKSQAEFTLSRNRHFKVERRMDHE